ncbi:peptidase [Cryobacterium sp. TMT2-10]|uniref:head maturation protease, ClpP-related n=1 Tax=Cryobacterium sp. TMT2-10 TaxID=1259244 RepID=UPI00106CA9F3|nr:head maturation protease, ClpP-related [Cryobacterium sp. TMT2-10]TFD41744.1 peptidase [Cryobacterium sp. TMT2-10]
MTNTAKHTNRYWGDASLPTSKAEFFNAITTPASAGNGTVATIRMYGPIDSFGGFWGISTKDMGTVLDALPETVTQIILRINSPGGEVFEGMSILNMLRAHKASVIAVVDGLAASAASFVAAGCGETVMSPGSQMMIHSPMSFSYGNAGEFRKTADVLDSVEASMVEIYTEKAGAKDWAALLADETWMTAAASVELGLADRIAVIPDAGETETVGGEELVITVPDNADDPLARVVLLPNQAAARPHNLPSSSELGQPTRKEPLNMSDILKAGLRERLGVTDSAISDELLLAAVDEVLAEQVTDTAPAIPAGTVLIDSAVLTDLQASAALGRQAREEQDNSRRAAIVDSAVKDGRIAPASRDTWLASLNASEEGTTALIGSLAKNTVPVAEIGTSDEPSESDSLFALAFGTDTKDA